MKNSKTALLLMRQVHNAAGGDHEMNVVTFMTRRMWRLWVVGVNWPKSAPKVICGSEVRIIKKQGCFAYSVHRDDMRALGIPE